MGLFWGRCLFFIGYRDVAKDTGSKFDLQNSPIMQFETTPTQSFSCDRCLVPLAWGYGFTSHGVVNFKISLCNQNGDEGTGNYLDSDKTRVKLFPNFTSLPFDYLLISWPG